MKKGDPEYKRLLDEYMREQYQLTHPKPNGMMGNWGWYAVKKREFDESLTKDGRLEKEGNGR